ncbi:MAG TPA: PQQ-dependent sugar dehydrogenase [Longimicrobium sp.]
MRILQATTLAAAALFLAACGGARVPLAPAEPTPGVALDTVARGLQVPWDVDFAPDGRIFVTERPGRIRVIEGGVLRPEPWATLPVARRQELGLMGIALAPDFARSGHVYVVGSFAAGERIENRVYRLTERDGRGVDAELVFGGIPAAKYHAGAALAFGPDGMLYLTSGDALHPGNAVDRGSLAGKVLRIRPDGRIPPDNPTPGSAVYALGVRNSQGIAWHPRTGDLFATEHGPSRLPREWFRAGRDELNVIRPGAAYGWPRAAGMQGGSDVVRPIAVWSPAIAPGGIAFYTGTAFPWRDNAFVAALRGRSLLRLVLEPAPATATGWRVSSSESLFAGQVGRIRAITMSPDGHLYFTTSNRDGRGTPAPSDDLLLRIVRR